MNRRAMHMNNNLEMPICLSNFNSRYKYQALLAICFYQILLIYALKIFNRFACNKHFPLLFNVPITFSARKVATPLPLSISRLFQFKIMLHESKAKVIGLSQNIHWLCHVYVFGSSTDSGQWQAITTTKITKNVV